MEDHIHVITQLIAIKTCEGYEFIRAMNVVHLVAEGNYTDIYLADREKPLRALCQLSKTAKQFNQSCFYQCHRSHIVNLKHLTGFWEKRKKLVLTGTKQVPISDNYLKDFRKMINCLKN